MIGEFERSTIYRGASRRSSVSGTSLRGISLCRALVLRIAARSLRCSSVNVTSIFAED